MIVVSHLLRSLSLYELCRKRTTRTVCQNVQVGPLEGHGGGHIYGGICGVLVPTPVIHGPSRDGAGRSENRPVIPAHVPDGGMWGIVWGRTGQFRMSNPQRVGAPNQASKGKQGRFNCGSEYQIPSATRNRATIDQVQVGSSRI